MKTVLIFCCFFIANLYGQTPLAENPGCVHVRAVLSCNTPLSDDLINVKLVDDDEGHAFDLMDERFVPAAPNVQFELQGCAHDHRGSDIEPELLIYHRCKGSQRKVVKVPIPKSAIVYHTTSMYDKQKIYNHPKLINLNESQPDESNA